MADFPVNIAIRLFGSKVPTSLMPFSDISQVTVLLDADAEDAEQAEEKVKQFFASRGIQLTVVPVRAKKLIRVYRETQVLISLVPNASWRLEYVVRRSRARFKAGRVQLPEEPFDLVVSDPEGKSFPQTEVFERMTELMMELRTE